MTPDKIYRKLEYYISTEIMRKKDIRGNFSKKILKAPGRMAAIYK